MLVRAAPGAAGSAALARHTGKYPTLTYLPAEPNELVNFGESVNFPLLFAVTLSVFGAATLLHLLLVSVARRRVEAGLLKALGFVRRQIAAAVCWQATAVAVTGIAVGAPTGIAAGKVLWRVFATNFGVVPVAVVEPVLIAALAAGVLAAANLLAAVPALLARGHTRPGCSGRNEPLVREAKAAGGSLGAGDIDPGAERADDGRDTCGPSHKRETEHEDQGSGAPGHGQGLGDHRDGPRSSQGGRGARPVRGGRPLPLR